MSGPTQHPHRRRRPRKVGDLFQLRRMFWAALLEAEHILYTAEDHETALKGIHAIGQVGGAYSKLLEVVDIAERLKALEAQLTTVRTRNGHLPAQVLQ